MRGFILLSPDQRPDIGIHMLEFGQWALSASLLLTGLVFVFAGALGVLRLPDFYTRLHAAGLTDTLGAEMVLAGLIVQSGFTLLSAKLALVGVLLFLTSPTATHGISNAAHRAGLKPRTKKYRAPPAQSAQTTSASAAATTRKKPTRKQKKRTTSRRRRQS